MPSRVDRTLKTRPAAIAAAPAAEAPAGLYVGTSGWAYPTWRPEFYPAGMGPAKFLGYYASRLTSVEVNYTFRTLPTAKQLEGWLAATGPAFRFTFKAPQGITHFSRLRGCEGQVAEFLAALEPVRAAGRMGLVLFQLPPNFRADVATRTRLAEFLALPGLAAERIAFEFRHESWFTEETYALLRGHNAAVCVAESDELVTPEVHTAGTHTAFRLRRNGGYTAGELEVFAGRLRAAAATGRAVYAYLKHEDEPTGALHAVALLAGVGRVSAGKRAVGTR